MPCSFDPLLVFSSRLAVVACLAHGEPMSFMELRNATGLADGNLHVQASRLVAAGLVERWREAAGGSRARTFYRITPEGRRRLRDLVNRLELSLEQAPPGRTGGTVKPRREDDSRVW